MKISELNILIENKVREILKESKTFYQRLMSGETLKLKDMKGNPMELKYIEDKHGISKGIEIYQHGKKVDDRKMSDNEIKFYLSHFKNDGSYKN